MRGLPGSFGGWLLLLAGGLVMAGGPQVEKGADPGNGRPVWTELPLKGRCGAIAGNSHRKHTATTAATRTSARMTFTGHGPGSRRHRGPYISAHAPLGDRHERRRQSGSPGDGLQEP